MKLGNGTGRLGIGKEPKLGDEEGSGSGLWNRKNRVKRIALGARTPEKDERTGGERRGPGAEGKTPEKRSEVLTKRVEFRDCKREKNPSRFQKVKESMGR